MLNLAVNLALIIIGLFFIATSIWGKRFYQANWRNPLWSPVAHLGSFVARP
jgi:hypothetical protein